MLSAAPPLISRLAIAFFFCSALVSAESSTHPNLSTGMDRLPVVGDQPDVVPELATDLSPDLRRKSVETALRKVADWELSRVQGQYNPDWTMGALYPGFLAVSDITGDAKYRNAMKAMGEQLQWKLGARFNFADDQVVGQTYVDLYLIAHQPIMIADTQGQLDRALKIPDEVAPLYWWADALFMAPPLWAGMYKATGNQAYLNYLDRQWWRTSDMLYDQQEHLFSRDSKYLDRKETNGKKMFWSRANGWVIAGLVRVLRSMPAEYVDRPRFLEQFNEMANKIASLQGSDGLWRPGLLNEGAFPLPETSGSAFYAYALAWGVNEGILDRATFQPVIEKAWKGLLSHVYVDGRFGCTQPVGEAPDKYKPTSSTTFGVGAFLLAGSEIARLMNARNP